MLYFIYKMLKTMPSLNFLHPLALGPMIAVMLLNGLLVSWVRVLPKVIFFKKRNFL